MTDPIRTALVEAAAKLVYDAMRVAASTKEKLAEPPKWVDGGNSTMQRLAERTAREIAALAAPEPAGEAVAWVPEDELPVSLPSSAYDALFPYSRVDGIRLFPMFLAPPPAPGWNGAKEAAAKIADTATYTMLATSVGDTLSYPVKHRETIAAAIRALTPSPATGAQPVYGFDEASPNGDKSALVEAEIAAGRFTIISAGELIEGDAPATGAQDAEKERAAVVAWLRSLTNKFSLTGPVTADYRAARLADAIERGDHLKREG